MMHPDINQVSRTIVGAAIDGHRTLGPGLLESAYEQCLAHEFGLRHIPFERQKPLPVDYKGVRLDCGYRLDFLVAGIVVVEVKASEALLPIHQAQLLSYLKLGGWGSSDCSLIFTLHFCEKVSSASYLDWRNVSSRRPLDAV